MKCLVWVLVGVLSVTVVKSPVSAEMAEIHTKATVYAEVYAPLLERWRAEAKADLQKGLAENLAKMVPYLNNEDPAVREKTIAKIPDLPYASQRLSRKALSDMECIGELAVALQDPSPFYSGANREKLKKFVGSKLLLNVPLKKELMPKFVGHLCADKSVREAFFAELVAYQSEPVKSTVAKLQKLFEAEKVDPAVFVTIALEYTLCYEIIRGYAAAHLDCNVMAQDVAVVELVGWLNGLPINELNTKQMIFWHLYDPQISKLADRLAGAKQVDTKLQQELVDEMGRRSLYFGRLQADYQRRKGDLNVKRQASLVQRTRQVIATDPDLKSIEEKIKALQAELAVLEQQKAEQFGPQVGFVPVELKPDLGELLRNQAKKLMK